MLKPISKQVRTNKQKSITKIFIEVLKIKVLFKTKGGEINFIHFEEFSGAYFKEMYITIHNVNRVHINRAQHFKC